MQALQAAGARKELEFSPVKKHIAETHKLRLTRSMKSLLCFSNRLFCFINKPCESFHILAEIYFGCKLEMIGMGLSHAHEELKEKSLQSAERC